MVCSSPFLEKQITNECGDTREVIVWQSGSRKERIEMRKDKQ